MMNEHDQSDGGHDSSTSESHSSITEGRCLFALVGGGGWEVVILWVSSAKTVKTAANNFLQFMLN